MALHFNFKIKADPVAVLGSRWHPVYPVLAVSTGEFGIAGKVSIYADEGAAIGGFTHGNASENCLTCQAFEWHPKKKLLCTGWKDGTILLWSEGEEIQEVASPHKGTPIGIISWTSSGDKVLTGDTHGVWCVWRLDRNTITQMCSNKDKDPLDGALTHVVFRSKLTDRKLNSPDEDAEGNERLMLEDEDEADLNMHSSSFGITRFNDHCMWFMGGSSGNVWGVDEDGNCSIVFNLDNQPIASLLYYVHRNGIVAMNQASSVSFYITTDGSRWVQQARFRISFGKGANAASAQMIWIGQGLLATCAHENMIRVWNIDANENYILQGEQDLRMEKLLTIAYNGSKRTIVGGTKSGKIMFWQYSGGTQSTSEEDWECLPEVRLEEPVSEVGWGPGESLISASASDSVSLLHGTSLKRRLWRTSAIIQLTPHVILYEDVVQRIVFATTSHIRVKNVDLAGSYFAAWNNKEVEVFHVQMNKAVSVGVIETENTGVALHTDKILVTRTERGISSIELYNHQLQKLSHLSIKAHEGDATHTHVNNDFLVVATSKNYISCWWIGGRAGEDKAHGYPKQLWEPGSNTSIESIAVNCAGTQIAVLAKVTDSQGQTSISTKLYINDLERDKVMVFDFATLSRTPRTICWDETEPRILACETGKYKKQGVTEVAEEEHAEVSKLEVVTLFASAKGIKLQERFPLDKNVAALIGLSVPNFYFYNKARGGTSPSETSNITSRKMRDFEGIDCTDPRVKEALLDFSYNLACGDMDAAYRSVKLVKDENVWTNMAQMCVKTGRLDVAEVCLGNMQDAKGARALREAKKEPEVEAHVAMLALQLGLVEDAERLYIKCGRYDLLNIMHQACGRWDDAIKTAEEKDRIHLRTIHYAHARHLESLGDIQNAIKAYEAAKCHGYEVPRMLYGAGLLEDLGKYTSNSNDKDVYLWWAQYCEANSQFEQALHFYKEAGDTLARVRLYCYLRDYETAMHLVTSPEHPKEDTSAAAYHLARKFEEQGKMKETLQFFRLAKAYKNAIRIARANEMEGEVMQLSLQADQATIIESAQWFEEQNMLDKAVILYKKGGELAKAIDLCVRGELFDTLQKLADDLDKETDPEVFIQCAEFFLNKEQHEKAVRMYIQAKSYSEALQVCLDRNVQLTEEMAEEMTLPKTENEDDEALRLSLLRKIAKVAKLQESWHLACKKYTQAGDRVKGMKVLLKSGDTDKIIFFTNHSRQKDIYILAAHYLQTCDWHNDPVITKHIITFYTKARAYESLSGFYDAIAQVYIDEFRDYDKALGALQDALKFMDKSKAQNRELKMGQLETKISYVEQFVEARNIVKSDPGRMVEVCRELLEVEDIEGAVRVGDVYALLVEFYTGRQEYEQAYQLIERMRDRNIILSYYLETQLVQAVYSAMGVEYKEQEHAAQSHHAAHPPPDDIPDDIDEEIDGED
eukprot:TRINITY_DN14515_c0_g1_i2.p1 TRINITY_DN14515_c0_g1~~TRINITY_DN14515_c0_g1_i2.p1  ORF type:complete len:1452 (+),score=600.81 TRINITY_DN14515_c0_g1_i2:52-4356(+)